VKRIIALFSILALAVSCGPGKESAKRFMEGNVEVVSNPLKPARVPGRPDRLLLSPEFVIDTEEDGIARTGLVDMAAFDVDSDGDIYLIRWQSDADFVYKFDSRGIFLKSFCRGGQGPGELEYGGTVMAIPSGEILIKDPTRESFLTFDRDGRFLRETKLNGNREPLGFIDSGRRLVKWQTMEPANQMPPDFYMNHFALADSNLEPTKELDRSQSLFRYKDNRYDVLARVVIHGCSRNRIFLGNSENGYEIRVYDESGGLRRKIRKATVAAKFPAGAESQYERFLHDPRSERTRKMAVLPEFMPPFRYMFVDDNEKVFVMTWIRGERPGEYVYDIFDADGVYIGTTNLDNSRDDGVSGALEFPALAKNGRLYLIRQKDNGFKELVVLRMTWTR
jgi:hypothetical protein